MILVDTSVWIDYLNNLDTPQSLLLGTGLRRNMVLVGDLVLTEILQGIRSDRQFDDIRRILALLPQLRICDDNVCVAAAHNFRRLRSLGITARGTVDTLIATRCIVDGHALLFRDKDFAPFVAHLGLRDAMSE
ncbi:MAG: VapC toxin family PIN domain ribonuclease [Alphaproteobacteria bacterium PA4]|nr:MAG: VapC toxin family PIN domain ribonuclease [Alphaproteobacteria bacterium PA4]